MIPRSGDIDVIKTTNPKHRCFDVFPTFFHEQKTPLIFGNITVKDERYTICHGISKKLRMLKIIALVGHQTEELLTY